MNILLELKEELKDPFIQIQIDNELEEGDIIYWNDECLEYLNNYEITKDLYNNIPSELECKVISRYYKLDTNQLFITAEEI